MGWKWAAHMAGIVTLMDAVLDGAVGVLSRQPLGVPWRPQALQKPSCQGARGTFLSGGQSECLTITVSSRVQTSAVHPSAAVKPGTLASDVSTRVLVRSAS